MEFASPRWGAYDDTKPLRASSNPNATYAVSAQYVSYADRRGVFARKIATNEHYKRLFRYEDDRPWFRPVLAFSSIRGRLLAIATGVQILVFDVDTKKVKHALKGNGRIVTSLAWAESKPGFIATGAVDGSICVWSLKYPARPLYHVRAFHGACNHVAFHPKNQELLAGCHENCISVWALPSTKPFLVTKSKDSDFSALRWFATDPLRVLGISSAGSVSIYDVHSALKTFQDTPARRLDDSDDEDTMFGKLEDIGYMPASDFSLGTNISQAELIGRNGLIILPRNGHILYFITFFADKDEATELWRLRLDDLIDCFSLRVREKTVQVVACMGAETQSYEVPGTVLDGMGWNFATSTSGQYGGDLSQDRAEILGRTMRPELHIYGRLGQSPPQATQASLHNRAIKPDLDTKKRRQSPLTNKSKSSVSAIVPRSMTSSLELPKANGEDEEQDSPMPFLSPSIPVRPTSLDRAITPLDISTRLPPRASFDSIIPAAGHDSDSDDETYAEHLRGSGSYFPGGVNVPLPRTCGASFCANGQLVLFLPTRAQPPSLNSSILVEPQETRERQNSTVARLFPHFGNLGPEFGATWSDSGSSPDKQTRFAHPYSLGTSSFENNTPWSARVSTAKTIANGFANPQTVKVTIHEVKSLQSAQQLAYNYRILPTEDETVSELCLHNATVAAEVSVNEAAKMWRMLAVLLEQKSCNKSDVEVRDSIISPSSKRPVLSRNISLASTHDGGASHNQHIQLNWLHHPMGRKWAMNKILSWAETQADVQLLACISSLLIGVTEDLRRDSTRRPLEDTFSEGSQSLYGTNVTPSIPFLRTDTNATEVSLLDDSSERPYSTRTSSRDPSLPTTPYIDSSASTPPLTLPPLNRNTTRLSASGSASPETQRSSFGAGVKYYAQTITDKLAKAGYSTSPPARKLGGSPGNELSASFPAATGSWSKSVSFAAGSDTAYDSRQSLSLTPEDDDYDSDRTIDEMSLPRTPNPSSGVALRELNGQSFSEYEPVAQGFGTSLLPEHLTTKSSIWRDTYAEQLRSWDLIIEAAEFENVADLAGAAQPIRAKESRRHEVAPHMDPQCQGVTCCICFCTIKAAKQLCPVCLHTSHKHCLEDFVAGLHETGSAFTCPTGCGCECTAAGDSSYQVMQDESGDGLEALEAADESDRAMHTHFAKERSLTDPRLSRKRLEGNSW